MMKAYVAPPDPIFFPSEFGPYIFIQVFVLSPYINVSLIFSIVFIF